jgi:hypothetical protein
MATFNKIINKVVNLDNNIFSLKYDKSDDIPGIYKIFFGILNDIYLYKTYKSKFDYIEKTMNNFYFLKKKNEKADFFNLFCKIQHIYHVLKNFVRSYKYKKAKLIVDTDLQLNQIKENQTNVICIYHVNSRYLFKIEELLKLIYISLTNCFTFFSEPLSIKNPYNNIPFGKSILYYIYFNLVSNTKIKFIKYQYIDIFLKFKEYNFNMTKFVNNYEHILREYAIKNYINNSTKQNILDNITEIIRLFNNHYKNEIYKIKISKEFPEDVLIRIMKPYLHLNLVSCYSLVQKNKIEARKKLHKKLYEFHKFNPQFGRKIIKFKDIIKNGKIKRVKSHIEFNMKHKKFNTYEINNFMNNHLVYKYETYEYEETHQETDEESQFVFNFVTHLSINSESSENTEDPTDEDPTDEDPTDEDPTDEDPTDEDPTDEDPTDEDPTDEDPTDEDPTDEDPTDEDDDYEYEDDEDYYENDSMS